MIDCLLNCRVVSGEPSFTGGLAVDMSSEFEFINQEVGEGDLAEVARIEYESFAANTLTKVRRVLRGQRRWEGNQMQPMQPLSVKIEAAKKPDKAVTPTSCNDPSRGNTLNQSSSSRAVTGVVTGEAGSVSGSKRARSHDVEPTPEYSAATPRVGTAPVISDRVHEFVNESTWWMVDLDAQVKQGATPLVKRCMRATRCGTSTYLTW